MSNQFTQDLQHAIDRLELEAQVELARHQSARGNKALAERNREVIRTLKRIQAEENK